jgi:hypothetical protein
MGIVEHSGDRAFANSMQRVGSVFDQVAEIANKKADQIVAREMERQGQEVALSKGFDPSKLKEPITMADTVFRESALSTYAIQLENDVEQNINKLYAENLLNPTGFRQKADAYATSVTQSLPQELKNGVSKMVLGDINAKHSKLQINMQNRIIEETQRAENARLEQLTERLSLAYTPEKKQELMAKIESQLENSITYITPQGKAAKRDEVVRDIIFNDGYNRVSKGEIAPFEFQREMEANGYIMNSSELNQIYSAASLKINYQERQYELTQRAKQRAIDAKMNNYMLSAYDMQIKGGSEEDFNLNLENAMRDMRASGATVKEIKSLRKSMTESYYTMGEDSDEALLIIDQMIFDGNKDAFNRIDQMFQNGLLTPQTRLKKLNELSTATADVLTDNRIKAHLNYFVQTEAPYANMPAAEADFMAGSGANITKDKVAAQKVALQEYKRRIGDMVVNGMTTSQIDQVLRNERIQKESEKRDTQGALLNLNTNSPVYSTVSSIIRNKEFALITVSPSGQKQVKIVSDEPWSYENYQERIEMMRAQNLAALKAGQSPVYSKEVMMEIYNAFE